MVKKDGKKSEEIKSGKYSNMYNNCKESGSTKLLSHPHVEWEAEGQLMVGKLLSFSTHKSSNHGGSYNKYLFDTDHGKVFAICGAQVDSLIGVEKYIGFIIGITFQGKRELPSGYIMKDFQVVVLQHGKIDKSE